MRAVLVIALLILASGCRSEPSFDERYNAQAKKLDETAAKMERDLGNQLDAAQAAGQPARGNAGR